MKILIHNDGKRLQGSERQLAILAEGLARRGHEVVASVFGGGELEAELGRLGVRTTRVRPRGDANLLAAARFWLLLRREQPDVMLCTSWPRLFWATLAGRLAGVDRLVGRLGIVRPTPDRWKYRAAFRRLDALITNSEAVRARFLASTPAFSAPVHVVHNATQPTTDREVQPGRLRDELALGDGDRLLLSVGTLAHRKGHDLVLDALAELPGPHRPHLAIAGQGPERRALRARAARLGLDGRVHFLGRRADVPALLADADLFVLGTRNDSLPNAMLEAMAAGVPSLVTTVAGVREALGARDGAPSAGWLVPPEDPAALAGALEVAVRECRGPAGRALAGE
ncbi:MAG: glycosyltransferase, partial [Longimicrobiales bacterium]|nr:glycosyltransferase [Longimicrobiales bacterium]